MGLRLLGTFIQKLRVKSKSFIQIKSIILLLLNVFFITASALAFSAIENKHASKKIAEKYYHQTFVKHFIGLSHYENNGTNHTVGHLGWGDREWDMLLSLHRNHCHNIQNFQTEKHLWNFWTSFDFCATVLTTIGYGSMSPSTRAGKWISIAYSIIGIPIMALYLALFAKGICAALRWTIDAVKEIGSVRFSDLATRILSLLILVTSLIVYVAFWSYRMDECDARDTYLTAVYFYVITLTTVGIGDISMTEAKPLHVMLRVLFHFCIGLNLVTSVFNACRSVLSAMARARLLRAHAHLEEPVSQNDSSEYLEARVSQIYDAGNKDRMVSSDRNRG